MRMLTYHALPNPCVLLVALIGATFFFSAPAFGQWVDGGLLISGGQGYQFEPAGVTTSDGCFVVSFMDHQIISRIKAQKIDPNGMALWGDGIYLTDNNEYQDHPLMISDGEGGVICVWQEDYEIRGMRLDSNGTRLWPDGGLLVLENAGGVMFPMWDIGSAGTRFFVVCNRQSTSGNLIQAVDFDGTLPWGTTGELLNIPAYSLSRLLVGQDGSAYVAYNYSNGSINCLKYNSDLSWAWDVQAINLPDFNYGNGTGLCEDGEGGILVVSNADGLYDALLGQRISGTGDRLWGGVDGVVISEGLSTWIDIDCFEMRDGKYALGLSNGNYNAIQVCDANGTAAFPGGPSIVASSIQNEGTVIRKFDGDHLLFFYAKSGSLLLQKVGLNGELKFGYSGREVRSNVFGGIADHLILTPPAGYGSLAIWHDGRYPIERVFGQFVGSDGFYCDPSPEIQTIQDLPNDQGGWVTMELSASEFDQPSVFSYPIFAYNVWRRVDGRAWGVPLAAAFKKTECLDDLLGTVVQVSMDDSRGLGMPPGNWLSIGMHMATNQPSYSFLVPTESDAEGRPVPNTVCVVTAHTTTTSVFFASAPDSGYSLDNIAPGVPVALVADYQANGVSLDWDDAIEDDFQYYRVYRSTDPDFAPPEGNLIQETAISAWTDPTSNPWGYYYKVTTLDHAGNESEAAEMQSVSGVGDIVVPTKTTLLSAYPNPFNPSTKLSFELATQAHVRLTIFDAAGRLVTTLIDEQHGVGRHEFVWNGQNETGQSVASGVYLYRFEAGDVVQTKRMMLLK